MLSSYKILVFFLLRLVNFAVEFFLIFVTNISFSLFPLANDDDEKITFFSSSVLSYGSLIIRGVENLK